VYGDYWSTVFGGMNGRKTRGVRRTNQHERGNHIQANHTRNMAVGSTAIRQAIWPVVYGEAL
jgi:hypothetical protein